MMMSSEIPIQRIITKSQEHVSHTKQPLRNVVTFFVVLGLVTLSLTTIQIFDGYGVTIAAYLILAYCIYMVNHIVVNSAIPFGIVVGFLIVNATLQASWIEEREFLKSFMLTIVMLFTYITSLRPKYILRNLIDYKIIIKFAAFIIGGFEFVQISEQLLMGSTTSWFWLDGVSISTADSIGRFEAVNFLGIFRPISFFHEPSYLAAICFVLLVINDHLFPGEKVRYILIASIILTLSGLMLIILSFYLAIDLLKSHKNIFYFCALVVFIASIFYWERMLGFSRLDEIFIEGTSGYVRVLEPLREVDYVLSEHPLGIPLGQSNIVFNNSIFLIPLYFGFLSPFLIMTLFFAIQKRLRNEICLINYFLCLASLMLVNGAIFTMESAFLLLIINYAFLPVKKYDFSIPNYSSI